MGAGMANFGLVFTRDIGVADLIMYVIIRCLIECVDEGYLLVVGLMLVQTIRAHGKVHVHTVWIVQNKLAPRGTVIGDA